MPILPPTLPKSSPEWRLDKILPKSRWPIRLFVIGWGLALFAIVISGLVLLWKLALVGLVVLLMPISRRHSPEIRTLSITEHGCTLRLDGHDIIELKPPYRSTPLIWWVSVYQKNGFTGRWFWLYRDQFSDDEWRQLMVLLRWSA